MTNPITYNPDVLKSFEKPPADKLKLEKDIAFCLKMIELQSKSTYTGFTKRTVKQLEADVARYRTLLANLND